MRICIDGNDGTGKTTLINELKKVRPQHEYQDRGLPSSITIGKSVGEADLYIILACPVKVSLQRLRDSGADMNEHWHQKQTLSHYHVCFLELGVERKWPIIDSNREFDKVLSDVLNIIDSIQDKQP